jgi:hypothetical protein
VRSEHDRGKQQQQTRAPRSPEREQVDTHEPPLSRRFRRNFARPGTRRFASIAA